MRYRLVLPASDGAEAVRSFLRGWLNQPALRRIVEASGGSWPEGSLLEQARALHQFSERWDFRSGGERLELQADQVDAQMPWLMDAAAALGLTAADRPLESRYDHAIVLGGTALASIYRLQRLYQLRHEGLEVGNVAVLTALRSIDDAELDLVRGRAEIADLVEGAQTEFDVMTAATARFSGLTPTVERRDDLNPHFASATAKFDGAVVMAAPSADPGRRANTRDNYDVYAERIGPADSVLIVSSSIYLPYQFFVGLQALGWEQPRVLEAVGFPPEWMAGVLTGPANVLQELRSALFAGCKTLERLEAS